MWGEPGREAKRETKRETEREAGRETVKGDSKVKRGGDRQRNWRKKRIEMDKRNLLQKSLWPAPQLSCSGRPSVPLWARQLSATSQLCREMSKLDGFQVNRILSCNEIVPKGRMVLMNGLSSSKWGMFRKECSVEAQYDCPNKEYFL